MAKLTGSENQYFESSGLNVNHKGYRNFVLENKLNELLETNLNARSFMTIDDSLTGEAGMIKKIHRYKYEGKVENLAKGAGNTVTGKVTYEPVAYELELAQEKFGYYDEDFMQDPLIVDVGLVGSAKTMVNDMNAKFFEELAKGTLKHEIEAAATLTYDDIVDAVEKLSVQDTVVGGVNVEDESGLVILVGADFRAELRKDDDFVRANQSEIIFSGQIGNVCGIPVVHSRKTPADTAYVFTKEAITLFTKKESEVEQERNADTRYNTVYTRKVNLCALTDDTKVIKIVKKLV